MHRYHRADVLRILHISAKQLIGWEKAGLLASSEMYSFFDLLQVKKVRDLRAQKVRPTAIRESLQAMQKQVAGLENPLLEASAITVRGRVAFRHEGMSMDPIGGQYMMEFAPVGQLVSANVRRMYSAQTASEFFARGVALEEDPNSQDEAIAAYMKVLEIEPNHAAAHINLGTVYYNRGEFDDAEMHYRKAVEIDSRYALAYFDLGNVLDETGRLDEAVRAYRTAIILAPTYADAHYNLALAFEKLKMPRKALKHWRTYTKLDANGPWAIHARKQIARTLENDRLKVVYRSQ
ncbi:TPR repeat protein [Candidatus Koribacter versatilis Ellin345]|uniref:TPR repeat protein n=1 Tax=Koribacter versatilis (strain Ellin345) TaxID=204669 RepID=Q1IKP3_KORVE|nr:tetratricopeptide repeat protein [Candidatus Koribacter versatilis]ABF42557.1 TPR repeat protein [Candidatus Koribacter versatilis Ellin345]